LPVGKKDKNIIGNKLIFGRFGLPCLRQAGVFPTYGRQASFVPISKENKATGVIADIHKIYYNGNQNVLLISLNKNHILLIYCICFVSSFQSAYLAQSVSQNNFEPFSLLG
jgi:hypothetical protein